MAKLLLATCLLAAALSGFGCAMCDSCYPEGPVFGPDGQPLPGRAGSVLEPGTGLPMVSPGQPVEPEVYYEQASP